MYTGKPIQCWVPVHYSRAWTEYAEDVCWAQNTYFLPPDKNVPGNDKERKEQQHITYYQWVSIFLGLQAMVSYLPYIIWLIPSRRFSNLLLTLKKKQITDKDPFNQSITLILNSIEEHLKLNIKRKYVLSNGSFNGEICVAFFFSRIFCILTCFGQIYAMNLFLGMKNIFFGATVLQNVIKGVEWEFSGCFPRVTICRFEIRNWKPSTVEM